MKIDESKMKESPSVFQRLKYAFFSMLWGVALFFVALKFVPFIFLSTYLFVIGYLIACCILGYFFGERFIETLAIKTDTWFDIKRLFRF